VIFAGLVAAATGCHDQRRTAAPSSDPTLRIGVAQLAASNPTRGLRQLAMLLALEVLARAGEDGRMQPSLAESWQSSEDGRTVTVKLRSGVKFSDASPLDAATAAKILPEALRSSMGPLFGDVEDVQASGADALRIRFRRASLLYLEGLEATMSKPGSIVGIGTGPYSAVGDSLNEYQSNPAYYLGRPAIGRILVSNHSSVRAAWAEALRGNLDMLYEVSTEALDSLEGSKTVFTFAYTRHYQQVIVLNSKSAALSSRQTRRALNDAIDRSAIVRDALRTHGVVSSGPVWPQHWALPPEVRPFTPDPSRVDDLVRHAAATKIRFTCLVPPNDEMERIALEVKRQLATLGVDMRVEGVSQEELFRRGAAGDYDALVTDMISGPTLLRPYVMLHSNSPMNWGQFGNATIDAALDRLRDATTEDDYRKAVAGLHQAFLDDPPAIFLAWSVRARAVSNRFIVPAVESGRDILGTLRLWKPATADLRASRN